MIHSLIHQFDSRDLGSLSLLGRHVLHGNAPDTVGRLA